MKYLKLSEAEKENVNINIHITGILIFSASTYKRMITKVTFVGENFTRKPPKYERFIRPTGLRFKKAHVTHPELQTTFYLDILGNISPK
jgi:ribosomal protein S8E